MDKDENGDTSFVVFSRTLASWITKQQAALTLAILCATVAELSNDSIKQGTFTKRAADAWWLQQNCPLLKLRMQFQNIHNLGDRELCNGSYDQYLPCCDLGFFITVSCIIWQWAIQRRR